jgi:UDP-glucose 4-epimerase
LVLKAVLGVAPPLKVFGHELPTPDGTCIRDYIHVNDLGAAHVLALDYLANGGESVSLNLGTGRGTSVKEIMDSFKRLTGIAVPHELAPPRAGDPPALFANATRAKEVLGWVAKRDVDEILTSAWKWQQKLEAAHYQL